MSTLKHKFNAMKGVFLCPFLGWVLLKEIPRTLRDIQRFKTLVNSTFFYSKVSWKQDDITQPL